jgi:hypothetical protein
MPPPTRASADEIASVNGNASDKTTATAWTMPRVRCEKFMFIPSSPAGGSATNMGSAAQKRSR